MSMGDLEQRAYLWARASRAEGDELPRLNSHVETADATNYDLLYSVAALLLSVAKKMDITPEELLSSMPAAWAQLGVAYSVERPNPACVRN